MNFKFIELLFQLIKTYVSKSESPQETIFTVFAPPNVGFYKVEIFAAKIPKNHGMVPLPLVAIFLVEVRLQFSSDNSGGSRKSSVTSNEKKGSPDSDISR